MLTTASTEPRTLPPPKEIQRPRTALLTLSWLFRRRARITQCAFIILLVALATSVGYGKSYPTVSASPPPNRHLRRQLQENVQSGQEAGPGKGTRPQQWLIQHSNFHAEPPQHPFLEASRPKGALISLVRNEELSGILQSMRELEHRFNHRHNYPWLFFSEKPFSSEFIAATKNITSAPTSYHLIPYAHWSTPEFIDQTQYMNSLDYLGTIGVGKGWMHSYRNMCRWNSGFFFHHPALAAFDYHWRVEPDVHFFCDIPYDPFAFLRDNGLVYGFNMNILEDARSFPSLWSTTLNFISEHPDLIHPDADITWLTDHSAAGGYNNCQFFSNFEIGSLNFFRSDTYQTYFDYLDSRGGFYYERFGDAPVHTLALSMFVPKEKVWFFRDIGYQHDIARHCPAEGVRNGVCDCEPTRLDENFYKLVPMESPQEKPSDTCVRMWMGKEWLEKKKGWKQNVERTVGGDGYGGYVKDA